MARINSISSIPKNLFDASLGLENDYYKVLIDVYKQHFNNNWQKFFELYQTEFFKFLNDHGVTNEGVYNLNSCSDIQLFRLIASVTHFYLLGLPDEDKKDMSNNFDYRKYAEEYWSIFNKFCNYVNEFLNYYDRNFMINSDMIERIVKNASKSYFSNLPLDKKNTVVRDGLENYYSVKKVMESIARQVYQEKISYHESFSK